MATVLCIDDHVPTLETLCWILEDSGYSCLKATNGQDGWELFRSNEIDLVILDQLLKGESGSELATRFKQLKKVPILMLSGWSESGKAESVDVLLIKPQEPRILLAAALNLIVRAQSAFG